MTLKHQVRGGIKWASISVIATRAARLLSTFVLARLLAPEAFGLVAIANVTMELIRMLSELGFGTAYVQRHYSSPEDDRRAANTIFWIGAVINVSLYLAATAATPLIVSYFNAPQAAQLLRVLFLSLLLDVVSAVPRLDLHKRLRFRSMSLSEISQVCVYAVVAVSMAFANAGAWSIIVGDLTSKIVVTVLLFRASLWRPSFTFDGRIARQLFNYGKFVWAFALLSGIGDAMDKLFVGRYYSAADLGVYSMAFVLIMFPVANISGVVNRVTFPLFSQLNHDSADLRDAFRKALAHVAVLAFPASIGILAVGPLVVSVLLSPKWLPTIPLINILTFYGLALAISSITGPVFQAIGKPNALFYTSILHHCTKLALLFAFQHHGLKGICLAVLIPMITSSLIAFILVTRYLSISLTSLCISLLRPAFAAGLMFLAVRILMSICEAAGSIPKGIELAVAVSVGIAVYLGASAATNRSTYLELIESVGAILRGREAA
jgi:O-antigen/teichoic acid export membrane protein